MKLQQSTISSYFWDKLRETLATEETTIEVSQNTLCNLSICQKIQIARIMLGISTTPSFLVEDDIKIILFEALLELYKKDIPETINIKPPRATIYDTMQSTDIVYGIKPYLVRIERESKKKNIEILSFAIPTIHDLAEFTFFDCGRKSASCTTKRDCKDAALIHLCQGKILHFIVDDVQAPTSIPLKSIITTAELKFIFKILPAFKGKQIFFWDKNGNPALPPWEDTKHPYYEEWKAFVNKQQQLNKSQYSLKPCPEGMTFSEYTKQILSWWPNRKNCSFTCKTISDGASISR